ncbi:hypothetical protein [Puniceibacterium sp. IMCC21224]|uniref:hypothetical protein n=1 Tax=Puniceibacterium sp. IMCC21224 TaxID=1618204 RepID=UPI00065D6624|nr:hypothetical protein [Puniceibacterium sp. IMCC21224]KMK67812.1 hypothetical protein IMCC21224_112687 [Puniceibacterium sp. IMCC21224]
MEIQASNTPSQQDHRMQSVIACVDISAHIQIQGEIEWQRGDVASLKVFSKSYVGRMVCKSS